MTRIYLPCPESLQVLALEDERWWVADGGYEGSLGLAGAPAHEQNGHDKGNTCYTYEHRPALPLETLHIEALELAGDGGENAQSTVGWKARDVAPRALRAVYFFLDGGVDREAVRRHGA